MSKIDMKFYNNDLPQWKIFNTSVFIGLNLESFSNKSLHSSKKKYLKVDLKTILILALIFKIQTYK